MELIEKVTIPKKELLLIFLIIFCSYNLVTITLLSGDTQPAGLLPFSILFEQSVVFNKFVNFYPIEGSANFVERNGQYVSFFPIVTPVLVVPLYVPEALLMGFGYVPFAPPFIGFMNKYCAGFITALGATILYYTLFHLFGRKVSLILLFIYAFCTSAWSIFSQALWQHGTGALLLSGIIALIFLNERENKRYYIIILGCFSGLFIMNRISDSILLIPCIIFILKYYRKQILYYVIPLILTASPFLVYNYTFFNSILGGYNSELQLFTINQNILIHFFGLLFSPNRGLFVYTPILFFSIIGYYFLWKEKNKKFDNFLLWFGPVIILDILIYSSFTDWIGGWSYGPRYLSGFLPVFVIYLGISINKILKSKTNLLYFLIMVLLGITIVLSFFIHLTGAFFYPYSDWNNSGYDAWSFGIEKSQIITSFIEGSQRVDSLGLFIYPPFSILFYDKNFHKIPP